MGTEQSFRLYLRRWFILGLFALYALWTQVSWIVFSPISLIVTEYYGADIFWVNALSATWMVTFVLFALPANSLVERIGMRGGLLASGILLVLGTGIRWWGSLIKSFWLIFGGHAVTSLAQLFTLGVPPLLSLRWFGEKERVLSTTIGSQAGGVGISVGFALAGSMVARGDDLPGYLLILFASSAGVALVTVLCFRSSPPSPPSRAAAQESEQRRQRHGPDGSQSIQAETTDRMALINNDAAAPGSGAPPGAYAPAPPSFLKGLSTIWYTVTCVPFLVHILSSGTLVGAFWTLGTVLAQVIAPMGLSSLASGWLGSAMTIAGMVSALLIGPIVDRHKRFKLFQMLLGLFFLLLLVGFTVYTIPPWMWGGAAPVPQPVPWGTPLLWILTVGMGAFMAAALPIALEYSAELIFPLLPENSSGTVMMTSANLCSLVLLVAMDLLITGEGSGQHCLWSMVFLCVVVALVLVAVALVPARYHRIRFERFHEDLLRQDPGAAPGGSEEARHALPPAEGPTGALTAPLG
ncbi:putative MFS-type transporter [Paratrimastix pyriformis]|uniref:MFS-type transporter n=1 Tax=Paratrimastix pyriformis TaxID=342808 RepID=A0ABQ8USC4_9EUKA|nr:putative MFS-type transporter [Paratrimastix pyriformis]